MTRSLVPAILSSRIEPDHDQANVYRDHKVPVPIVRKSSGNETAQFTLIVLVPLAIILAPSASECLHVHVRHHSHLLRSVGIGG
jgi:hypothetical protein